MKSLVEKYLELPFKYEIVKVDSELGGGFRVTIPELGSDDFITYGDTIDEAITNMNDLKTTIFEEWLSKGMKIPDPRENNSYSGKLLLRMPPALHKKYSEYSRMNKISLNTAILIALETQLQITRNREDIKEYFSKTIQTLNEKLENIRKTQFMLHGEFAKFTKLEDSSLIEDNADKIAVAS